MLQEAPEVSGTSFETPLTRLFRKRARIFSCLRVTRSPGFELLQLASMQDIGLRAFKRKRCQ